MTEIGTTLDGTRLAPRIAAGRLAPSARPMRRRSWRRFVPLFERSGRFSPLKALALIAVAWPAADFIHTALTVGLEPWPVKRAIRFSGEWSTWFLFLTLAVTPARRILDWSRLIAVRRILGLAALAYGVVHLLAYAMDVDFNWGFVASETVQRLYLTVGFVALAGLGALGFTSTDGWIRRLGRGWNRLHLLIYPLAAVTFLHIVLVRFDVLTFAYLAWLLGYRLLRRAHLPTGMFGLLALAAAVCAASLAAEFIFSATRTGLDPWRILAADFDPAYGIRRAAWKVLALGIAVAVAYGIRRIPLPAWIARPVAAGLRLLPGVRA